MAGPVNFTRAMLARLKKALAAAGGRDFVFEGNEMDPGYARYLIEYLEGQFGVSGGEQEVERGRLTRAEYAEAVLAHGDLDQIAGVYTFFLRNPGPDADRALQVLAREFRPAEQPFWRESNLNSDQADCYDMAAELFGGAPYERMGPQRRGPLNGLGAHRGGRMFLVKFAGTVMGYMTGRTVRGVATRYAADAGLDPNDSDLQVMPIEDARPADRDEALGRGRIYEARTR